MGLLYTLYSTTYNLLQNEEEEESMSTTDAKFCAANVLTQARERKKEKREKGLFFSFFFPSRIFVCPPASSFHSNPRLPRNRERDKVVSRWYKHCGPPFSIVASKLMYLCYVPYSPTVYQKFTTNAHRVIGFSFSLFISLSRARES